MRQPLTLRDLGVQPAQVARLFRAWADLQPGAVAALAQRPGQPKQTERIGTHPYVVVAITNPSFTKEDGSFDHHIGTFYYVEHVGDGSKRSYLYTHYDDAHAKALRLQRIARLGLGMEPRIFGRDDWRSPLGRDEAVTVRQADKRAEYTFIYSQGSRPIGTLHLPRSLDLT